MDDDTGTQELRYLDRSSRLTRDGFDVFRLPLDEDDINRNACADNEETESHLCWCRVQWHSAYKYIHQQKCDWPK